MKSENDEDMRRLMGRVADYCANRFWASPYPNLAFDYPDKDVLAEFANTVAELHIRTPAASCLPKSLEPTGGDIPSKDEIMVIFRSCPAIERLHLYPKLQRCGFLNALLKELARRGTPYVLLSNIENRDLAQHYLELSRCSGSGIELTSPETSPETTASSDILPPTFAINLRERYRT